MTIQIVTDFRVLMQKAHRLGQAKKGVDQAEIASAQADHDAYKELCLKASQMSLGTTYGEL